MSKQSMDFLQFVAQTSDAPLLLEIEKAEGIYLYGKDKTWIDCISGIGVSNVGHCNPAVVKAVTEQAATYMHLMVYGELVQKPQVSLASLLASHLPASLNSCYFVNSGSEAVEGAMKLAKRYTGRSRFVALRNAYHGSTQGALSLMSDSYFSYKYYPLLPGVSFIDRDDIAAIEQLIDHDTAAVFAEPIMGEAGYKPCSTAFLQALRKRCTETGTLLVFDEIQSGYGRSGKLFAFEHSGIVPDVLLLAKAMGGGMPLGAFIADRGIMACLQQNPVLGHITTFGGHPVSCAASEAAFRFILDNSLHLAVPAKEQLFRKHLQHPAIQQINGIGMMLALEFQDATTARAIIAECVENGLLVDWFLYNEKSLRLAPPLIITDNEIKMVCDKIHAAIKKVAPCI